MSEEALVRAAAVHDALAFLDKFEPGAQARVLARVPPASRECLLQTARSAWVSLEHDHYTVDAIVELFGVTRAVQYWRATTTSMVERPLLKSFVSGMISVFGRDPGRVVAILPTGFLQVYRNVGEVSCDRSEEHQAVVRFEHVASAVRAHPNYFHSWHGTCLGVADLARIQIPVEFTVARDRGSAQARFHWH